MRISSLISLAGFVLLIAATYCPLFRPIVVTWDMYKANLPYGIVVLLVAVLGIVGIVLIQPKLTRQSAWLSLILVVLFYLLSLLKIHYQFKFIPFHAFEKFMDRQVKLKWGWWLLLAGPLLANLGTIYQRPTYKRPVPLQ